MASTSNCETMEALSRVFVTSTEALAASIDAVGASETVASVASLDKLMRTANTVTLIL